MVLLLGRAASEEPLATRSSLTNNLHYFSPLLSFPFVCLQVESDRNGKYWVQLVNPKHLFSNFFVWKGRNLFGGAN